MKALDAFTMLRPSPVSRLLGARDLVYAHFQLQMEYEFIIKRRKIRIARELDVKQTSFKGVAKIEEKEKGQAKMPEKEVKQSLEDEKESKLDLECQSLIGSEPPLYVTSAKFFGRMRQTFNDARSRRALVCVSTAMISQQLCGINTIDKHRQISKQLCGINTIDKHRQISKYSTRQVFASSHFKATSRLLWTHLNTLYQSLYYFCKVFLFNTLLRTFNASDRTGAWVGFGIGICNSV